MAEKTTYPYGPVSRRCAATETDGQKNSRYAAIFLFECSLSQLYLCRSERPKALPTLYIRPDSNTKKDGAESAVLFMSLTYPRQTVSILQLCPEEASRVKALFFAPYPYSPRST